MKTMILSYDMYMLIMLPCSIFYVALHYTNLKQNICVFTYSCSYNITVDRGLVIDLNSISSKWFKTPLQFI